MLLSVSVKLNDHQNKDPGRRRMRIPWSLKCLIFVFLVFPAESTGVDPYTGLTWFLQISDVHISYKDEERTEQFRIFTQKYLEVVDPDLVLCSGDLTDAKIHSSLASDQLVEEWTTYHQIVGNRSRRIPWLDIRGNHDNLNVLNRQSENNLFRNFSEMGPRGFQESYKHTTRIRGQTYNFIALDATLDVGLRFPFNFVGDFPDHQQARIRNLTGNLDSGSLNIYFGHYPSSVVRQPEFLLETVDNGLVYLNGHLHDLALLRMHDMYAMHGGNNLELELCDWKENRVYRLLAVDQGFLSFTDEKFETWPVILPTVPKNSEFLLAGKEPDFDFRMFSSIRVLAFSDVNITSVDVQVDDGEPIRAVQEGEGPLYTAPWDPQQFKTGLHRLTVRVADSKNRSRIAEQMFALDKTAAVPFHRVLPSLVLSMSIPTLFQAVFYTSALFSIFILPLLKALAHFCAQRSWISAFLRCCLVRRFLLVASCPPLFWLFSGYPLFLAVGPWVVGSIVESEYGAVFTWGSVVSTEYVPSQVGYLYYFVHFVTLHPAVLLLCGHILDCKSTPRGSSLYVKISHCAVVTYVLCSTLLAGLLALIFWLQFGPLGFFFGPLRTWSFLFYSACVVYSVRTRPSTQYTGILLDDQGKKSDGETDDGVPGEQSAQVVLNNYRDV